MYTDPHIDVGPLRNRLDFAERVKGIVYDVASWVAVLIVVFCLIWIGTSAGCGSARPQTVFTNCVIIDSPSKGSINLTCDATGEQVNEAPDGGNNGQAAR